MGGSLVGEVGAHLLERWKRWGSLVGEGGARCLDWWWLIGRRDRESVVGEVGAHWWEMSGC